jgi:uncharacterized protein YutE (UPF0331/DUF86 family)
VDVFLHDRTTPEVVVLNLLSAIQSFGALADHDVIERQFAPRLASSSSFRNLVGHPYRALDWRRVHGIAAADVGDLEAFCAARGAKAG